MTNAAGRGSGPHCPQSGGTTGSAAFMSGCAADAMPEPSLQPRSPARLDVSPGHAAPLGARGHRPAARRRAGRRRRSPTRASSPGCARAGTRSTRSARRPRSGRLAYGYMEDLFPPPAGDARASRRRRARRGLEPALIERIWTAAGFSAAHARGRISEDDLQLLRYIAAVLAAGFPLVAFLQLVRVYGQALARIADAEVRLFHLYVHEPLIRDGVAGPGDGRGDGGARRASCCRSPRRSWTTCTSASLQHFVEQDVVGHLEIETDDGRSTSAACASAIAFADLAGYTRLTEEAGEEQARRPRRALRGGGRGARCPTTRA